MTANSKWNLYFSLDESESAAFGDSELETASGDSFTGENDSDADDKSASL